MITFPSWVEGTGRNAPNAAELARRRMRYMLVRASIECTEAGTVASLADLCGLPREHLHYVIRAGGMSPKAAAQVERACGANVVKREWLIYPLEIEEMSL